MTNQPEVKQYRYDGFDVDVYRITRFKKNGIDTVNIKVANGTIEMSQDLFQQEWEEVK